PAGRAAVADALPGHNQYHRKPPCRSAHPDPPRNSLAKRQDGDSMVGLGLYQNRKEVQQDHGLSRSVDLGSDPQRRATGHPAGCCVVTSTQPPPATFNYARDMLVHRRKQFDEKSIVAEEIPAYETDGWQVDRRLKRSIRVKRPKAIDERL